MTIPTWFIHMVLWFLRRDLQIARSTGRCPVYVCQLELMTSEWELLLTLKHINQKEK